MLEGATILNINRGAIPQRFAKELGKVLDDIGSADKILTEKRTITIEISIEPGVTGENAIVIVKSKVKLPAMMSSGGVIELQRTGDGVVAGATVDVQTELFESSILEEER